MMDVTVTSSKTLTLKDNSFSAQLEDLGGKAGRAILRVPGGVFSAYWPNLGERTVEQFIAQAPDEGYLVAHFDKFGTLYRKIDPTNAKAVVINKITERAEAGSLSESEVIDLTAQSKVFDGVGDINGVQVMAGELLNTVYGPGWFEIAPELQGKHTDYKRLQDAVSTLRQAVSSLSVK